MAPLVLFPYFRKPASSDPANSRITDPTELWVVPRVEPFRPSLFEVEDRLATFSHEKFSCNKTPEELATAGFYYSPSHDHSDRVQCFWCSVVFYDWEDHDDTIKEHARVLPDCLYLRSLTETSSNAELRKRWSSVSICREILTHGLSRTLLDRTFDYIFGQKMAFPSDLASLCDISRLVAESSVRDTTADPDSIKCINCLNQANILFQPCGHVSVCFLCSREIEKCPVCSHLVTGCIHVHLC